MQWIYLICFILISAGLLALFGVKPGDFIDALFRSQRKSATLSDELNVLLGTPAKGFFNQDYELKQILKGTGRADRYEAIKRLSLILFAVGAVLALLIWHGISDIKMAFETKANGYEKWWSPMILGIISLALGIICIVNAFGVVSLAMKFIGVALIYDGISDLWIVSRTAKAAKAMKQEADALDVDYKEVDD